MAHSDKNIVITPNIGSTTADPRIVFSGADASSAAQNITLQVYPTNSGTLSFEGSAGQLFSITNSMSGTIFSANDVSGIPSIEVLDTGVVKIAQYSGLVGVGTADFSYITSDNTPLVGSFTNNKLYINGSIQLLGNNDSINFGRGTGTFLKDEEIGFGWGSGWYMIDGSYLRVRNNTSVYTTGDIRASLFYDSNDTAYYINPNGGSFINTLQTAGSITVGNGASSDIYMTDTDETTRRIHCNSSRIGFLNSTNGWGGYCDNAGNWYAPNISGSTSGTNTGDNPGVTSVSGTAPVVSSGGNSPAISMAAASSGVNGYMTGAYATKLDGIAAGATNISNTNQLTNGAGYITSSGTAAAITSQANSATITASTAATANQIVLRDGSGDDYRRYGFGQYFNMSHGVSGTTTDTIFYSSGDDYIRKNNATGFRASLNVPTRTGGDASGTWSINITGNAATAGSVPFDSLTSKASGTGTYTTSGDFRAPIFYDSNDTGYFVNPATNSTMNALNVTTLTSTGALSAINSGVQAGSTFGLRSVMPGGAVFASNFGTGTGAIKITLPANSSPMIRFTVKVYTYDNGSFDINCGGHTSGGLWYNTFAYMTTQSRSAMTVRFSYLNSVMSVYIGELGSTWSYPQIFITDVQVGYSDTASSTWDDNWIISLNTSTFENVSASHTVFTPPSSSNNTNASYSSLYYDSDNTARFIDPNGTSNLVGLTVTNTITGNISGNANTANTATSATSAASATNATTSISSTNTQNVNITNDTSSASIHYPMMTNNTTSGMAGPRVSSTKISFIPSTGALTCAGNITAFSDERLKTDWKSLPVDFVNQLALIKHGTYTRIDTGERQVGISAQSLQPLLPEAVIQTEDNFSIAYGNAALVSAVELAKKIVEQDARIALLEKRLSMLLGD